MTITGEQVAIIIGFATLIGGFLAWWFAKVLSERKEDITQSLTLKYLGDDMRSMKADINEIKIEVRKIAVIEEKLKHLK